jgi:hypothetical protein
VYVQIYVHLVDCGGAWHEAKLFPHQCRSLEWMRTRESDVSALVKGNMDGCVGSEAIEAQGLIARGGLLCDDPGLGKTVTVLSLILQTMGQSTEQEKKVDKEEFGKRVFQYYWESLLPEDRKRELCMFWKCQKDLDHCGFFDCAINVSDPYFEGNLNLVKQPISMSEIKFKSSILDMRRAVFRTSLTLSAVTF